MVELPGGMASCPVRYFHERRRHPKLPSPFLRARRARLIRRGSLLG